MSVTKARSMIRFVLSIFENIDINLEEDTNAKDHALRWSQRNKLPLPEYQMVSHFDGMFTMQIFLNGHVMGQGTAKTKKEAEQIAAYHAMVRSFLFHRKRVAVANCFTICLLLSQVSVGEMVSTQIM